MKKWTNIFLGSTLALASACGGGGSNNDQGASFSLIGFNATDDSNVCQPGVFQTAISVGLSDAAAQEFGDVGAFSCLTIQNNMSSQFVRADRVFVDYFVPGAELQPPSTSSAIGLILGPAPVSLNDGGTGGVGPGGSTIVGPPPFSSLPSSFTAGVDGGAPQVVTAGFNAIPVEVREYLALNRLSLPEPPFQMTAIVRVGGVTSSGDSVVSNEATLLIVVVPDNIIAPTTGNGGGQTALEGDPEFFNQNATDGGVDSGVESSESSEPTDEPLDFDFS